MVKTERVFDSSSNTGTATTRAQVIPLPSDGGIRNPEIIIQSI